MFMNLVHCGNMYKIGRDVLTGRSALDSSYSVSSIVSYSDTQFPKTLHAVISLP